MTGITVCTANLDFAKKRRAHVAYLAHLITICDVLLVQEAKKIRLRRLLPPTWATMQRVVSAARRGSAISWHRPMQHHDTRLRLGALPAVRRGARVRVARMLPRYIAVIDTVIGGHLVTLISAHWPPLRYSWLWPQMDRRVAAVIVDKVKAGCQVALGADFNTHPATVADRLNKLLEPHGIRLTSHDDGRIDGLLTTSGLAVTDPRTDRHGIDHGLTDHPAYLATITPKESR